MNLKQEKNCRRFLIICFFNIWDSLSSIGKNDVERSTLPLPITHVNGTISNNGRKTGSVTTSVPNAHFSVIQGEQMVKKIKQGAMCQFGISSGGTSVIYPIF